MHADSRDGSSCSGARVYVNGRELALAEPKGMFLRRRLDITDQLGLAGPAGQQGAPAQLQRPNATLATLTVLVAPPDNVGIVDLGCGLCSSSSARISAPAKFRGDGHPSPAWATGCAKKGISPAPLAMAVGVFVNERQNRKPWRWACRGQGGDHMIARDVTALFTEGWDWMQPVRDRDTGIFDSVELKVCLGGRHRGCMH